MAYAYAYLVSPQAFTHREFSFTLRDPGTQAEVYLRFLSYANPEEFRQDLMKKNPEKMDLGAVYSAKVCACLGTRINSTPTRVICSRN